MQDKTFIKVIQKKTCFNRPVCVSRLIRKNANVLSQLADGFLITLRTLPATDILSIPARNLCIILTILEILAFVKSVYQVFCFFFFAAGKRMLFRISR